MRRGRSDALGRLVAVGLGIGCSVGEIDYEGKTCPCPSGYRCDDDSNTCTRHEHGNGGASGDGNGGSRGGDVGESGDESGGTGFSGAAGNDVGGSGSGLGGSGSGKGGSGVGGTGVGGSGLGGGKGGTGVGGSGTGGSTTGGSATGGSGTGGTGVPVICSAPSTCASLPNDGRNLVAASWIGSPIIDCSKNCIGFLADILTSTDGDVTGTLDIATGDICVNGRVGVDSSLDIRLQPSVWDAAAHATSGFEFTIEGSDVPSTIEFGYQFARDAENPRCVVLAPPSGHHSVRLDSVHFECLSGVDFGTSTLTELLNVHFFVATTDTEETFDFCITGLAATR